MNAHAGTVVTTEPFGTLDDGTRVDRWTLTGAGLRVRILTYGGIVQTIEVPDRHGTPAQVALGFADLDSYLAHGGSHFGALVGRYANRIGGASFDLDGRTYRLARNDGPNCLHGGERNFAKAVWDARPVPGGVALRRVSPDGEEGFPGTLDVTATYTLTASTSPTSSMPSTSLAGSATRTSLPGAWELRIDYRATTDAATVVNLTNHTYVNLAGDASGSAEGHVLRLAASRYTPVDAANIPVGGPAEVAGTRWDFRRPRAVGRGYDHNFVLDKGVTRQPEPVAELHDPLSGRRMRIATTEPGVQLYTAEHLDGSLVGSGGHPYAAGAGIALETQHFPDSPNRPDFPGTVLRPSGTYRSTSVYGFSAG
ncbi:aldose epimerase family protein [Streptomyces sp. MST-110588]|uniref:aldose epimerase family protein n=1 Tax=Streptomyces sp. MST-110588 TaxID=2833628 RepID=UPI001F5D3C15|nr:aldose epimerase family protein [Streptomyces sp. MST-110588]UNO42244.1 galactose mutarotase [Streptomyces sp. MST-110588]